MAVRFFKVLCIISHHTFGAAAVRNTFSTSCACVEVDKHTTASPEGLCLCLQLLLNMIMCAKYVK